MTYENVDKDPDLRKKRDLESTNKPWIPWVLLGGIGAVLLIVGAGWASLELFGWASGNGTGTSQASAAGAWASAAGATALAITSVWLAWRAEVRAKEDMERTENRHEKELEAAENRLTDELEAQRRHQQLMAISPIWNELVALSATYAEVSRFPEMYAIDRDLRLKAGQAITDIHVAPVIEASKKWSDATANFDLVCSNALMMVTEPDTAREIAKFYAAFRLLQSRLLRLSQDCLMGDQFDVMARRKELDSQMTALRRMRRTIIRSAREYIVGAEWLDLSVDGVDPFEFDEPTPAPRAGHTPTHPGV